MGTVDLYYVNGSALTNGWTGAVDEVHLSLLYPITIWICHKHVPQCCHGYFSRSCHGHVLSSIMSSLVIGMFPRHGYHAMSHPLAVVVNYIGSSNPMFAMRVDYCCYCDYMMCVKDCVWLFCLCYCVLRVVRSVLLFLPFLGLVTMIVVCYWYGC